MIYDDTAISHHKRGVLRQPESKGRRRGKEERRENEKRYTRKRKKKEKN